MTALPAEIDRFLHEKIPLVRAMGARVASYGDGQLVMEAPLDRNHNHLGTAFGGSLDALATLAGYTWLWLELRDTAAHIVIQRSSIAFLRPVRQDLRAVCRTPGPEALAAFRRDFARRGKGRIRLEVTMEEEGAVAVTFEGAFVAVR